MIIFTENTSVYISITSIDFRCGISKVVSIVADVLDNKNPMSNTIFIFRNKKNSDIKALYYDGNGYWLLHKRLSRGKFSWWPRTEREQCQIPLKDINILFGGNDPRSSFDPGWEYSGNDEGKTRDRFIPTSYR